MKSGYFHRFPCLGGVLIAAVFLAPTAWSQNDSKPPLPAGPIIGKAPNDISFSVKITQPDGGKLVLQQNSEGGAADEVLDQPIVGIKFDRKGGISREVFTRADGKQHQKWIVGSVQLMEDPSPDDKDRVRYVDLYDAEYRSLKSSLFSEFRWIKREHYAGVRTMHGRTCYIFIQPKEEITLSEEKAEQFQEAISMNPEMKNEILEALKKSRVPNTAGIDTRTRLPVFLADGDFLKVYEFHPPVSSLSPPDKFARRIKEEFSARQKANKRRSL